MIGGLGSLVAELIATTGVQTRLHRAGIQDRWGVNGQVIAVDGGMVRGPS